MKHFVIFITFIGLASCKQKPFNLVKIEGKQIPIDSTYVTIDSISNFITPYHDRINQVLDSTLAYAPFPITKVDGDYNTTAGNLLADIVFEQANPIFKSRTGHEIDFVLLNHGGIRSIISSGKVSARTAFEVMPFENQIVVAELSGSNTQKLVEYIIDSGRAHPISGLQIILDASGGLFSIKVQDKPLDLSKQYYIATSDYLATGGDDMIFFKEAVNITNTDYLIRNAMIDYFKKVDTIAPKIDARYYKLTR
ncbi:MAG: 5'-nucleotidase [Flavobacteriaceae bacterium]